MRRSCPPVMICGFNRPDCLRQVFARVREMRPEKLFLCLDGPREGRVDDVTANDECKKVFDAVDWDCDVVRDYSAKNLGCKIRMETGVSRMFDDVEFGLIFEDDCVAHPDFFRFAEEIDERYHDDERIGAVCSSAPSAATPGISHECSYYFNRFPYIWGWGTWRRAWRKYSKISSLWPTLDQNEVVGRIFPNWYQKTCMIKHFNWLCTTEHEQWDGVWWITLLNENLLSIHPDRNLMTNIGHKGLHACRFVEGVHDRKAEPFVWPLIHPERVVIDKKTECLLSRKYAPLISTKIKNRIFRIINREK